jgi:hypothetical protein
MKKQERQRLIKKLEDFGCFDPLDCGFVHFWPVLQHGALSAEDLRAIADELDRRNVEIKKQYREMRTK